MDKKSQISIFIMVGVVLLIMVTASVYLINEMKKKELETGGILPKAALKNYITLCVENTGSYALLKLGMQGGYTRLPENYLKDSSLNVAYAYDKGYSFVTLEQMSGELSDFMDRNLKSCVYQYIHNRQMDYELELGDVKTETLITEDDIMFDVDFPVTVIENNTLSRYDSFGAKIPVRLKKIHEQIDQLLQKKKDADFNVYLDCIYDPDMDISVVDYGNPTLFIIEDRASRFKNIESKTSPYRFLFAVRD